MPSPPAAATPLSLQAAGPGPVKATADAAAWIGKEVIIGARVMNTRGRASEWSNLVALRVVPPLRRPAAVAVEPHAEGVKVTWSSPASQARVFRKAMGAEGAPELQEASASSGYVDRTAEIGKRYEYLVQAVQDGGAGLLWLCDPGSPLGQPETRVLVATHTVLDRVYEPLRLEGTHALDGREVRVRYHANPLVARFALMRVVREYAHNHSVRTGGVMLHAAAVTFGDFAIAIYDSARRQLFLARDRFGVKPLYYAQRHGRTVFASEITVDPTEPAGTYQVPKLEVLPIEVSPISLFVVPDPRIPVGVSPIILRIAAESAERSFR